MSSLTWLQRGAMQLITWYQQTLSLDHGPLKTLYPYGYCRHSPTCSEYTKQSIASKGIVKGSLLGMWQVLHCHPWHKPSDKKILEAIKRGA